MSKTMPALFIGHGNPMNAIESNEFSLKWEEIALQLPKPKAVLCISAHWETWGTMVTGVEKPDTIHDFGGFPEELYRVSYPAKGNKSLAAEIAGSLAKFKATLCHDRGLDHGCWSVLKRMYPKADVPVLQLSLDQTKSGLEHFEIGKALAYLREQGVLIMGSGNLVHNLYLIEMKSEDFNEEYGFDWAIEANEKFKALIVNNEHDKLCKYGALGQAVSLAVPTPEHYLPMLYTMAVRKPEDKVSFFNDKAVAGSLTMTGVVLG